MKKRILVISAFALLGLGVGIRGLCNHCPLCHGKTSVAKNSASKGLNSVVAFNK
jgi:hypothetical protein